jgi:hypothetical protein
MRPILVNVTTPSRTICYLIRQVMRSGRIEVTSEAEQEFKPASEASAH